MIKYLIITAACLLASACGTTATSNAVIDPSIVAPPICQPKFGLPGCYSGGGGD